MPGREKKKKNCDIVFLGNIWTTGIQQSHKNAFEISRDSLINIGRFDSLPVQFGFPESI
jgi:hypothetical protein